jgi:hypothetical protein
MEITLSDAEALSAGHELDAILGHEHGKEAHSRYKALLRELMSFERALQARHRKLQMAC